MANDKGLIARVPVRRILLALAGVSLLLSVSAGVFRLLGPPEPPLAAGMPSAAAK